jgi:hypothetical protein
MLVGGQLVLINSLLTSLVMFILSFFRFHKEYLKNRLTQKDQDTFGEEMDTKKILTCQMKHPMPTQRCICVLGLGI